MKWYLIAFCTAFFLQNATAQQFEWAKKIGGVFNDYPLTITKDKIVAMAKVFNLLLVQNALMVYMELIETGDSLVG